MAFAHAVVQRDNANRQRRRNLGDERAEAIERHGPHFHADRGGRVNLRQRPDPASAAAACNPERCGRRAWGVRRARSIGNSTARSVQVGADHGERDSLRAGLGAAAMAAGDANGVAHRRVAVRQRGDVETELRGDCHGVLLPHPSRCIVVYQLVYQKRASGVPHGARLAMSGNSLDFNGRERRVSTVDAPNSCAHRRAAAK